jgi:hypothetical protein
MTELTPIDLPAEFAALIAKEGIDRTETMSDGFEVARPEAFRTRKLPQPRKFAHPPASTCGRAHPIAHIAPFGQTTSINIDVIPQIPEGQSAILKHPPSR